MIVPATVAAEMEALVSTALTPLRESSDTFGRSMSIVTFPCFILRFFVCRNINIKAGILMC